MTLPEEIEKLKARLDNSTTDIQRADILLDLAAKSISLGKIDVQPYLETLLVLADKLDSNKYKALALTHLAVIDRISGNYAAAIEMLIEARCLFEQMQDKDGIAMVYNRLGITYQYLGDFPESLKNHFAALRLREETQNQSGIAASYNNMGMIYGHLGNTPQARHSYLAALKIEEKAGNKQGIAAAITNLATIERSEGNYADALTHLFASIALMEQTGNMHVVAVNYSHIGNVYAEQYKYDDALTYYGLSLDIQGPLNYKYGIVECLCNRGTVYFRQGKYTEALQDLLQSLALSEEMDAKDRMKECYQILSDCYEALGDLASALAYFKKYHEVQKEILGAEAHKKAAALHFQKEMELKEKELNFEKREKELNQKLLLNMLPAEVADELKNKGDSEPRHFEHATVMFTDFKNFTAYSEKWSAKDLIGELNACFSAFDEIIAKHHIEKIKTMGDGFIAASGLPIHNESHALNMVNAAIEIRDFMLDRKRNMGDRTFEIRIGIHSGKVVAGIVGISKYAYDIWGDTVNTASRMEQHSEGGKINISEITYELIKEAFHCKYRGEIEAKNKGKMKMYFVD